MTTIADTAARLGIPMTPLVSHVDDPRPIAIGDVVSRRSDPLAAHRPMSGRVVERWHNCDGEAGLVVVDVAGSRGVNSHRLLVADVVTEAGFVHPADRCGCDTAARGIFAAVGAGKKSSLSELERRWLHWASALLQAGRSGADVDPYPA